MTRYELPHLGALQFVGEHALGGGVTTSLGIDAHGKSLSSALLEMEIENGLISANDPRLRARMSSRRAFIAAVRHHQAGQLAEADRLYGAVLAAEPSHAHALHLRGALAHAAGRHQDAVDLIARALARDEQPDFHHNIGLALSALGRRRDAADHWARAVAINPNHAAARLNLGNVLHEARACRRRGAAGARMARSRDQPVVRQVHEPREEAALRGTIPQLTPIEDATSQAVQAQYETNPYPRWVSTAVPQPFASVETFLREMLPAAPVRATEKSGSPDILIAGCGTGQHAIMTARQYGTRVLAIDLSRASLAYAAARTRALGLDIEYAQADIMRLAALGRNFDLIESNGVLHHMTDPYAGWRVLLSLLRPGGFMRIGLYSERARWGVVEARAFIAQAGYGVTPAEIRRFRHDLMRREDARGEDAMARNIMWFNDFYSTSECRDLLFHVQEHRMTLPQIKAFLVAQELQFLGFEIDPDTRRRYAARFPADAAMTDLDRWHAFEQDNPHTFANMYQFWVQKAG